MRIALRGRSQRGFTCLKKVQEVLAGIELHTYHGERMMMTPSSLTDETHPENGTPPSRANDQSCREAVETSATRHPIREKRGRADMTVVAARFLPVALWMI